MKPNVSGMMMLGFALLSPTYPDTTLIQYRVGGRWEGAMLEDRRRVKLLIGLLVVVASVSIRVDAIEPKASLQVNYYEVSGNTAREIRNQLNDKGPMGTDGKRYGGYTSWKVYWKFQFVRHDSHCAVRSFSTRVEAIMTLPKWQQPKDVSSRLVTDWNAYISALRLHEDGHYELAKGAARAIMSRVASVQTASNCEALDHDLQNVAAGVIVSYRDKEVAYDAKTHHGATQGAIFLP